MATNNAVNTSLSGQTGTGSFAGSTSPSFVTPILGTPTSGTLTTCTGLPVSTGISGLGTGVATFLATPSSANLLSAMTTSTGSGLLVFGTSPTFITPLLGTPSSGTLTNCTGLPVAGGGTGVASLTAYAVICGGTTTTGSVQSIASVGSTGQVLTSNGAGALPTFQAAGSSSGSLINVQVFKAGGTYTPTSGMSNCIIQCIGGGGAGGGTNTLIGGAAAASGGGGSGGYSQSYVSAATIGASQTVTIGAGGTGVANGTGNTGGDTSVGSIIIAKGGIGSVAISGTSSGAQFGLGGSGGATGTGDITAPGSPGQRGLSGNANINSGAGGNSFFGSGAQGVIQSGVGQTTGNSASANTGAGGSGSMAITGNASTAAGGAGGSGIVIIYEYK